MSRNVIVEGEVACGAVVRSGRNLVTVGEPSRGLPGRWPSCAGSGVGVMLDDFGTGYSSLSYLHRFPVDVLKIDRSFILGLAEGSPSSAIVGAIVGMGHSLGLRVVAEGIETEEQAAEATRLGCDSAQGYLFARPAPPDTIKSSRAPAGGYAKVAAGRAPWSHR